MAKTATPALAQDPKTGGIMFGTGSESTVMDPATVAPTEVLQAGSDGAIVTALEAYAEDNTVVDERMVLWLQPGGTGNWYVVRNKLMSAITLSTSAVQTPVKFVDSQDPGTHIRLAPSDKLGVTHHVDQQSMVTAQWTDF